MKKPCLCLLIILVLTPSTLAAIDYYSDRMNFPPGESRFHNQTLTNTGTDLVEVNATVPPGFNVTGANCTLLNATLVSCLLPPGDTKYFTFVSPSNCTEGTIYTSTLTSNSSLSDEFNFVCIPDNKITDCKVEYGHGDANYLSFDQPYISNESITLFNLIRVFNIGQYLSPNEDAVNATVQCTYEKFPIRTYGRVEINHGVSSINGTFQWTVIQGGYWFRIGVVSQDVSGKAVGDYYNVSCSQLTYTFEHEQVIANTTTCDLEIRDTEPFAFTVTNYPALTGKLLLTITNSEKYDVSSISFDRLLDNVKHTETIQRLESGESVSYAIDAGCNTSVFFIPSWYQNSFNPIYYTQSFDCTAGNFPPILDSIGNLTAVVNTTFVYDVNATDANGDNLTFFTNTTFFAINSTTGIITFTPNSSLLGNHSILISVFDDKNASDTETINLEVVLTASTPPIPPSPPSTGGGGGGGGRRIICIDDWQCSDWSSCIDGKKTRSCTYTGSCPSSGSRPLEEESCLARQLDLMIVSSPEIVSIKDNSFSILADVENTGGTSLQNVRLAATGLTGWSSEIIELGSLAPGTKKRTTFTISNKICSVNNISINSVLEFLVHATAEGAEDIEPSTITLDVPELTILTDANRYLQDDAMQICILANNPQQTEKQEVEFELNIFNAEAYLIDYLSPYTIPGKALLKITKEYILEDLSESDTYTISVTMYENGQLFSSGYAARTANTSVFIIGFREIEIFQAEGTIYRFEWEDGNHSLRIQEANPNSVTVVITSRPKTYTLSLLETTEADLDEDGRNDVSFTYMGMIDSKADIRMRTLPRDTPPIQESTYTIIYPDEKTSIKLQPKKNRHIFFTIFWIILAALLTFFFIQKKMIFKKQKIIKKHTKLVRRKIKKLLK